MLEEEGMVIAGLLVGLNVLDCNMCIKGEDLDQPVSFSFFYKFVSVLLFILDETINTEFSNV